MLGPGAMILLNARPAKSVEVFHSLPVPWFLKILDIPQKIT